MTVTPELTPHRSDQPARIAYLIPGPIHRTALGQAEVERREAKLASWAAPGTSVTVRPVESGPASIESMYEEYLSIAPTAVLLHQIEEEGYDAGIIGCFGDP